MRGNLWKGTETEEDRVKREIASGLRSAGDVPPAAIIVSQGVIVSDGVVQAVVLDFHGDPASVEGELVEVTAGPLPVVGEPLPWPRAERQARLDTAQWTQAEPIRRAMGKAWASAWDVYMQALRDLPETQPDASRVAWPAQPI